MRIAEIAIKLLYKHFYSVGQEQSEEIKQGRSSFRFDDGGMDY